jgi:hypothetical protein
MEGGPFDWNGGLISQLQHAYSHNITVEEPSPSELVAHAHGRHGKKEVTWRTERAEKSGNGGLLFRDKRLLSENRAKNGKRRL